MDWWLCGDSCVVDVVVGSGYAVKVGGGGGWLHGLCDGGVWCWRWADG